MRADASLSLWQWIPLVLIPSLQLIGELNLLLTFSTPVS
jgi:hypothetical protein